MVPFDPTGLNLKLFFQDIPNGYQIWFAQHPLRTAARSAPIIAQLLPVLKRPFQTRFPAFDGPRKRSRRRDAILTARREYPALPRDHDRDRDRQR